MPISANRPSQTGPKSQSGGVNSGFISLEYQEGIAEKVKILPISPAVWQNRMEVI